jgi:hypothetical protein
LKFQDCYNIRKKILNNSKHPDLIRISLLLVHLQNAIKEDLLMNNNKKTQEILQGVNDQISNSRFLETEKFGSEKDKDFSNDFMKDLAPMKDISVNSSMKDILNAGLNKPLTGVLKKPIRDLKKELLEESMEDEYVQKKPNQNNQKALIKPQNLAGTKTPPQEINKQSTNNNVNTPIFELAIDKEFMASLSTDLVMKLADLKKFLKDQQQKNFESFNPNEIIMNSEFIKGLNGLQYSAFVQGAKGRIESFNQSMKNYKEGLMEKPDKGQEKSLEKNLDKSNEKILDKSWDKNAEKTPKNNEKTSGFGGLPRSNADIGGFLKLNDLKRSFY